MRFDAVVFDSGGTLFENPAERRGHDEPTCAEVWQTRFSRVAGCLQGLRLRFDPWDMEAALKELEESLPAKYGVLYSYDKLMAELLRRLHHEPKGAWVCLLADAYAGPRYVSWLFAGVPEMLAAIEEMSIEIHLAVNTAWCGFSMKRGLQGVGLLGYFRTRTYSSDAQLAKPDERFFRLVEKRAHLEGRRVVYVGDRIEEDVKGPKAIGWAAALRLNKDNRADAHLADYTFTHSSELVAWLVEE